MGVYDDFAQEIARVAYEIYEKSGRIGGREMENWLEAERIVMARYAEQQKVAVQAAETPLAVVPPAPAAENQEEGPGGAGASAEAPVMILAEEAPAMTGATTVEESPVESMTPPQQEETPKKPARKAAKTKAVKSPAKIDPKADLEEKKTVTEEKKTAARTADKEEKPIAKAKKTSGGRTKKK